MFGDKEQYFLPHFLYTFLKNIYVKTIKSFHEKILFKKILGKNILLVQSNSGETFLLVNLIANQKIKFDFDSIYFIHKYQKDVFDLYFKNYNYVFLSNRALRRPLKTKNYINCKNIICFLGNDFWQEYFLPKKHIKSAVSNFLKTDENFEYIEPYISEKEKESTLNKIREHGFLPNKYVFLNTSAQSMTPLDQADLKEIYKRIEEKGLKIFVNDHKSEKLYTLREAIIIASYARQIISLRSGLTEILCIYAIPIHAIYTKGKIENFYEHYTLKKYNFKNKKIFEYTDSHNIVDNLMKNFEAMSYE